MAKGKKKQAKTAGRQSGKQQRKPSARSIVDIYGKQYARLLNDPCYAPIVPPCYDSPGSGHIIRVESDFILGAEATSVGCAVLFCPGLLATLPSYCSITIPTTVVNSDTGTIVWTGSVANQPGNAFASMFSAVRAVSACLQVSYVGSELTRAGVVGLGQVPYSEAATFTTTAALRTTAERVVKMPDGTLEVKLVPTDNSRNFSTIGATDQVATPCLFATVTGIPVSTGMRIRCVSVLELLPKSGLGVVTNVIGSKSNTSLTAILNAMNDARPGWRYDLLTGMAAYAAKAALAV